MLEAIDQGHLEGQKDPEISLIFNAAKYRAKQMTAFRFIPVTPHPILSTRTRFALTYAYHLPVGQWGEQLLFGISGAYEHVNLDPKGIVGSGPAPAVAEFNGRKNAFEVDYGMAYTDPHVTVQGSLTNLIGYLKKFNSDNAEASTLYLAAAYKFIFNGMVNSIEPEACLRGGERI